MFKSLFPNLVAFWLCLLGQNKIKSIYIYIYLRWHTNTEVVIYPDISSKYFVKLVWWENNNKNPNVSNMCWLAFRIFTKKKNLVFREVAFFSLVAAFDKFFFWLTKKGADKKIYMQTEKNNFSTVNYKLLFNHLDRQSVTASIFTTLQSQVT